VRDPQADKEIGMVLQLMGVRRLALPVLAVVSLPTRGRRPPRFLSSRPPA
jgi:hypothetical protein